LKQNYPQGKANLGIEIHGISNEGWFWRKGWHKLKYWTKRIIEKPKLTNIVYSTVNISHI
jgi:hypothetical protein